VLLAALTNAEANGALRSRRRRDELPQRLEDLAQLLIVLTEPRADVQI
jgi:hypothetical protein